MNILNEAFHSVTELPMLMRISAVFCCCCLFCCAANCSMTCLFFSHHSCCLLRWHLWQQFSGVEPLQAEINLQQVELASGALARISAKLFARNMIYHSSMHILSSLGIEHGVCMQAELDAPLPWGHAAGSLYRLALGTHAIAAQVSFWLPDTCAVGKALQTLFHGWTHTVQCLASDDMQYW